MARIVKEPKIITDFNNDPICILPIGFDLTDDKWDKIWALYDKLERFMGHAELLEIFPDDESLVAKRVLPVEKIEQAKD